MKVFLIIQLFLISSFSFGNEPDEMDQVFLQTFPKMNQYQAIQFCLNQNLRLPTEEEIKNNLWKGFLIPGVSVGNFAPGTYWTSSAHSDDFGIEYLIPEGVPGSTSKGHSNFVFCLPNN